MSYTCTDFTDSILDALRIDLDAYHAAHPDDDVFDSPSIQADLALEEIERLQRRDAQLALLEGKPKTRLGHVRLARALVRTARDHLREAGAKSAADYVRHALKSIEGAERHALRLHNEAKRNQQPIGAITPDGERLDQWDERLRAASCAPVYKGDHK